MHDALVLAGGAGRRMGGVDKAALVVGGRSLLDRVLLACASAATTVVVGPARATSRPVTWAREEPAGAGPVAAVRAGLEHVTAPHVLLLAADQPFLEPSVLAELLGAVGSGDGAMLVDSAGREQYLCSAWRTAALRGADLEADRLGALLRPLSAARVLSNRLPAPWTDCDTADELELARALVAAGGEGRP